MNYVVVFDAAARGYSTWPFAAAGLPFVVTYVGDLIARLEIAKDDPGGSAECRRSRAGG